MSVRKRIIYRGQVQGVGFRATCHSIAARHDVGGHVRNLAGGGVELVLEGEPDEIQAVLDEVARQMEGYIRDAAVESEPPRGEREFRIAR